MIGKALKVAGYRAELKEQGLITFQQVLKEEKEAGKEPPGKPKTVGGVKLYPPRHFA